jgi:uncharacterized membrane protein
MQKLKTSWTQIFKNPEKAFLSIGLVFGILFLLVIPPFQVPDEPAHFYRAYQVSEGKFIAEKRDNIAGGLIPKSLSDSVVIWNSIPFHPENKTTKKQFLETFNVSLKKREKFFAAFPNTALYSPIPYLPQAIGIALGKVLYLSPIILLYLGRLTNLIISVYLTFLAIKITPFLKWVFFLLALTPMATFQRGSLSADSFINSIAILLITTITKCAFDINKEKIVRSDIVILCLLTILLSLSKQAYFLIPFLCFLIPKYKFGNQKKYLIICFFLSLTSAIAWISWAFVIKGIYVPLKPDIAVVDEQVRFILSHPERFALILFNDFNVNVKGYLEQFIGVLGWLDTQLPGILHSSYTFVLLFIALIDSHPNVIILLKDKLKVFAVLSSSIFLLYLLIYLSWNPVGQEVVEGVQGRYFIPLAPLLLLLFYNRKISLNIRSSNLGLVIVTYSLFALTISLAVLLNRYYNL